MSSGAVSFGPFSLDSDKGILLRDGEPVTVAQSGILILAALIEANGGVVTKQHLLERGWPGIIVEEANLSVQIAKLRAILDAGAQGSDWIVTVPRVGYRLLRPETDASPAGIGNPSIAVLPFQNLGGREEQDYQADGLVDDLITGLSRFRTFSVVARSSSFAYKGRAVDSRQAATELGVRYLLEGSIRRSAERIRINTQLVEGTSGVHIWAEQFDGEPANFFDFQDQITRTVIGLIEPQINKAEIDRARQKRPDNLQAWDHFVQAVPLVHSAKVADYDRAIDHLRRAIAIDPNYTPALTFASWAHERRKTYGGTSPEGEDDWRVALDLAHRAVASDSNDAMALTLLGWERILFEMDEMGLELCERGVALNPNNRSVLDLACVAHVFVGDLEKVITYATRAMALSPGAPDNYACATHISEAYCLSRRFEEGCRWARRSIQMEGRFAYGRFALAMNLAHLDRLDEARKEMDLATSIWPEVVANWPQPATRLRPERWGPYNDGLRMLGLRSGEPV